MTLSRAAWIAGAGTLARGVFYFGSSLWPAWGADLSLDSRLVLLLVAVVDPLIWFAYFSAVALKRALKPFAWTAAALGILQLCLSGYRIAGTLSVLDATTITFLLEGVLGTVCWTLVLIAQARGTRLPRASLMFLLVLSMLETAFQVYGIGSSYDRILDFGRYEPWRLIVSPAIWLFYWISQTLYISTLRKTAS